MTPSTRILHILDNGTIRNVPVVLNRPVAEGGVWACHYEIGWPEGAQKGEARGGDGIQATYLAMQKIAVYLYMSSYHQTGKLYWERPGQGYGFPMPREGRDQLVGEDKLTQG